jgi:hypothetical protein
MSCGSGAPTNATPHDSGAVGHALARLRILLLEQGGLMRSLLVDPSESGVDGYSSSHGPAQIASSGPRVNRRRADYELLVEAIYEGYLLHYHSPRIVRPNEADLSLLAGDSLYALGLARLVAIGDIEAVSEFADVITLSALAHGGGEPEMAEAVWMAGARAVGWGASPQHEHAKALTRAGSPDALDAMLSLGMSG